MNPFDKEDISDYVETNKWIKYVCYCLVGVGGIWLMGKCANLLADATNNFKKLSASIKQ